MAYRIEQDPQSGEKHLVIDGFERGIADSPYDGIGNMLNMGIRFYPGVAYINYRRQLATIAGGTMTKPIDYATSPGNINYILDSTGQIWKQSAANSTTFNKIGGATQSAGTGIAYWNNYLVVFRSTNIDVYGDGTGDSTITTGNVNLQASTGLLPMGNISNMQFSTTILPPQTLAFNATRPAGATTGTLTGNWSYATGTYQITFSDGEIRTGTFTNGSTAVTWTTGLTSAVTANITVQSVTGTISSYTDPAGNAHSNSWFGYTGFYQLVSGGATQKMLVGLTYGSATVTFVDLPSQQINSGTSMALNIMNTVTTNNTVTHKAIVSKNDGKLYFCNGNVIGLIQKTASTPGAFNSQNVSFFSPGTVTVNYSVLSLPSNELSCWLTDFVQNLYISGIRDVYPWDRISTSWQNPVPINEPIDKTINILNVLYILAGQKGNIYSSNGYSASLFRKIPDYIAGVIDPVFSWGGIMAHRGILYFQIFAQNPVNTTGVFAGIFSITTTDPFALNMEAQNSFGLVSSTTSSPGVLIDNSPSTNGNDSYYSAWSNGVASVGGIDYNDTSVWQNFEPVIETDIIPVGSFLTPTTFSQVEFKLDRPMVSGDQIRLSFRTSLSDSYTTIGTTTTAVLSDMFASNINTAQWVQFKVEFKGASSSSSYIPLREIRLHYGN